MNIKHSLNKPNSRDYDAALWTPPFRTFIDLSEYEYLNSEKSLVLVGPPGCGKTTLLRKYSNIFQLDSTNFYIGICLNNSSQNIPHCYENQLKQMSASVAFTINFILEIVRILNEYGHKIGISQSLVKTLFHNNFNGTTSYLSSTHHEELFYAFYVNNFRHVEEPHNVRISNVLNRAAYFIEDLKNSVDPLFSVKFLLQIDNYDELDTGLQSLINTLMKFTTTASPFSIRVTKTVSKFLTYQTINRDEYLKSGSDYKEVNFNTVLSMNSYKEFLTDYTQLRLEAKYKINRSIIDIVGSKEDFVAEANSIVGDQVKHFASYNLKEPQCDRLRVPNNALLEMMNALKTYRYIKSGISQPYIKVQKEYNEFIQDPAGEVSRKYFNDFSNKYRLSLLILLCKIYNVKKKYYSFNTIAYITTGNIRLYNKIIDDIVSEYIDAGYPVNSLPPELQTEIIQKHVFEEYKRVKEYSIPLYNLLNRLGKSFKNLHEDLLVRYPETNQFYIEGSLSNEEEALIDDACKQGIFIKKRTMQRKTIGKEKRELFILNRSYAPIFQISYRIRGGFNFCLKSRYILNEFEIEPEQLKFEL